MYGDLNNNLLAPERLSLQIDVRASTNNLMAEKAPKAKFVNSGNLFYVWTWCICSTMRFIQRNHSYKEWTSVWYLLLASSIRLIMWSNRCCLFQFLKAITLLIERLQKIQLDPIETFNSKKPLMLLRGQTFCILPPLLWLRIKFVYSIENFKKRINHSRHNCNNSNWCTFSIHKKVFIWTLGLWYCYIGRLPVCASSKLPADKHTCRYRNPVPGTRKAT